jgi:acetyl-CoA C-acetyltransferase
VVSDSMMMDGLEDAYDKGKPMGAFAEDTAGEYQFTRDAQDSFAIESLTRANAAVTGGGFVDEIVPVTVRTRGGDVVISEDEQPGKAKPEKIPGLRPAFAKEGTITAATSASISDGAAALVLTRASVAARLGLTQEAIVVATAAHAHEPAKFTTAPVAAIRKVLDRAGWSVDEVDLFEVNEAFATVAMIAMHELGIPRDKLNVNGGATALGHPIGASGARIIATIVAAHKARGLTKGVAALCIGGGEATAVAVELVPSAGR